MPFNGSNGTFNRLYSWTADAAANINILASRMDAEMNGFAAGLSNCVTRDGQSPPTADLPMGGKKFVNLGAPTTPGDAATKAYVDGFMPLAGGTFTAQVNFGDTNFYRAIQAGNSLDSWDNNDFTYYDRANNAYSWNIAGTQEMRLDAANLILPTNALVLQGGNITFQNVHTAERQLQFARSGATSYMYANAGAVGVYDTVLGDAWSLSYGDNIFRIKGQTAWHAGNFNPAAYAALSGATFGGGIQVNGGITSLTDVVMQGSGRVVLANSGDITAQRSDGTGVLYLGNTGARYLYNDGANMQLQAPGGNLIINGAAAWHTGNLNPAQLSGAAFSGQVSAPTFLVGTNTYLTISGGNPILNWAPNVYTYFDVGARKMVTIIDGAAAWSVDSAGTFRCRGDIVGFTMP